MKKMEHVVYVRISYTKETKIVYFIILYSNSCINNPLCFSILVNIYYLTSLIEKKKFYVIR